MTYKEFQNWCNDRACDGRWGIQDAMLCIQTLDVINTTPFWKRKKVWKEFEPIIDKFMEIWKQKVKEVEEQNNE